MPETLLARKFADAIGAPFTDAFRYQYAISERALDLPEFARKRLGSHNIYHSTLLPATSLAARDGTVIGYALGHPVTPEGRLLEGTARLDIDAASPDALHTLEAFVQSLSGRHVVVLCLPSAGRIHARLYLDCIGALSAIYDPRSRICASSLLLALNRDIDPHPVFGIPSAIMAMPELAALLPERATESGLQATSLGGSFDRHARQLLSNHVLDLTDFTTQRLPLPEPPDTALAPQDAAQVIVERLHSTMSGLGQARTGYLAISGGLDSRMLMAAAPEGFSDRMTYYSYSDNWITGIDMRLAEALAQRIGARFIRQPQAESDSYFDRPRRSLYFQKRCAVSSGLKTAGDNWWSKGYFRPLLRDAMWLRGNALEVVTARLWTPTVDVPFRKALRHAMRRLGLDVEDRAVYGDLRQQIIDWRDTLPEHWRGNFHDFWYQELYLSHSQTNFLGLNELTYFPPASDRTVFHMARSVNPGLRRDNALYDAIIAAGRPALSELPSTRDITREIKQTGLDLETVISLHM